MCKAYNEIKEFDTSCFIPLIFDTMPIFMEPRNSIRLSTIFNIHDKIRNHHGKIMSLILIGNFDRMTKKLVNADKLTILYYIGGSLFYNWNWFYETSLIKKLIEKIGHNKKSDDMVGNLLKPWYVNCYHCDDSLLKSFDIMSIFHIIINTIIPNFPFIEMELSKSKEDYVGNTNALVVSKK